MSQQQHTHEPVADAELKIYQQRIDELKGFKLPCDINFVNGKVGKGCSLYTLQLRILNHGEALRQATRIAEKQRDTLLEAAEAVVERWDSPLWKDLPNTGEYINRLRAAIASMKEQA